MSWSPPFWIVGQQNYYVRIFTIEDDGERCQTMGPYHYERAVEMMQRFLSQGLCSWIEVKK